MNERVFIANFGRGNYEWPVCLKNSTVATMSNENSYKYWCEGDREAFIQYCIKNSKTAAGITPTRPVASRWFNLMTIVSQTQGDVWIHREKEELWWTISLPDPPTITLKPVPNRFEEGISVYVCHKPCQRWSNSSETGALLNWSGLHPKAKEFLFTEGTLQQLGSDNAQYALALTKGDDLSPWHERADWKEKQSRTGRTPVERFGAKKRAAARMALSAESIAAGAQGQTVERTTKIKELRISRRELEKYLEALLQTQEGLCAISTLPLQYDGECDDMEMLCSLDRIDSDGHYEPGNLQVVCRFINRWKSDQDDVTFRRLLSAVRDQS